MRDLFTYPKPPFATAKRWRPPHPSLVLFAVMFMAACGGGGGGSPASKPSDDDGGNGGGGNEPDPTIIVITPAGEDAKPLKSAEGALLPEKIDGTSGGYKIGTLSDNNDGSGNVTYALDNPNFRIDGKVLYYIGADSGYFEAMGTLQSYGLKIVRKDGDNTPETFDYVVNLQNVIKIADIAAPEAGLYLRPVDDENLRVYDGGDSFTENADGTDSRDFDNLEKAVLPKGADGSSTPVVLGTFAHDTKTPTAIDGAGDGDDIFISYHYSLAANSEGNLFDNLFSINEDNQLLYIGAEITPSDIRPTFLMGIASRIKVTINLPDGSYYNLETDGRPTTDAGNINDHKFALNGGGFSDTNDVAEVGATASVDFGGLVLTAKSSTAADNGYRILIAQSAGVGDSNIAITLNGNLNLIIIQYGKDVNFDDLKGALDTDGDGVSDGDLAGLFDVTTDGTPTYDGTAKLSASAIDTSFVLAGGGASTKANAELESGVTIEAKGSGTGYDGIEIIGRYNSDLAAGEVRIDSVDATGTGKITIHYGKDATLAELIQAFITHYTTDYSGSNLGQLISQPASSSSTTLLGDIFGVYTGIITEDATIPGFRTIDVASGRIYVADTDGDGSNSKIILFNAVDDMRIDATSYVIVTDKNNDGIGEVEAATEAELKALSDAGTDFYVLGKVDATKVPQMVAASTPVRDGYIPDGSPFSFSFMAGEEGTAGNGRIITFAASADTSGTDVGVAFTAGSTTDITITYDGASTMADLKAAFADGTLAADIAALYVLTAIGPDSLSLSRWLPSSWTLTGGADALYTHTATIGNVDVAIATTTSSEVVIKTIYTHTSGHITDYITDDAVASMATKDGTTTITVFFDRQADTQDIIDAIDGLDGVSAAIVSGGDATTHALTNDDYAPLYPLTITSSAPKGSVTLPGGLTITVVDTPAEEVDIIAGHTFVNAEGELQPSVVGLGTDNIGGTIYARIAFGLDSTLEDLYDQIYDDPNIEDTDPNDGINDNDPNYHQTLRVTKETGYDGTTKLVDIFAVSVTATPEVVLTTGDAPTANPTATADNKFTATQENPEPFQWETFGDPSEPEDFTILGPDIL